MLGSQSAMSFIRYCPRTVCHYDALMDKSASVWAGARMHVCMYQASGNLPSTSFILWKWIVQKTQA